MASSKDDPTSEKRPQFGARHLTDPDQVFQHNAWDNVEWDDEQQSHAQRVIGENSSKLVDQQLAEKYETQASSYWDEFYGQHKDGFFKDRHWLFTEFPELAANATSGQATANVDASCGQPDQSTFHQDTRSGQVVVTTSDQPTENVDTDSRLATRRRILEVGCGVGNTVFPLLEQIQDPNLFVYCCDFSSKAIQLVKENQLYDQNRCCAFVCDMTQDPLEMPIEENSLDIITLIFVLSAIHPTKMKSAVKNLVKYLKPGGRIFLRDYGRYDMAQLRFKNGRCISENFYVRGDGTRVYFFSAEELDEILTEAGLVKEQNYVDRRLQVNRGKLLKMYRIWIQCKYRKCVE